MRYKAPGKKRIWFLLIQEGPVWLFLLCASAIAMYPVLKAPNMTMIGWMGDNLQFLYIIGWMLKALRTGAPLLIDPHLNPPGGLPLASTDTPFLSILAMSPIGLVANDVFLYNAIIFLSYFLSGLFTYLWMRHLTHSRFAGLVAGLIFMWTPYRIAHSYGHLHIISTQFIPLFFMILDKTLTSECPTRRDLAGLSLATFLVGAMSQYYLVICLMCGLVYAVCSRPDFRYLFSQGWKFAVGTLAGGILSAVPYLMVWKDDGFKQFPILQTRQFSANLADYFIPSRLNPIWGEWIDRIYPVFNWIEYTHAIGLICLILAVVALTWRDKQFAKLKRVWVATTLFAFILSLGTDLHLLGGKPIMEDNPIWLPSYFLGQIPILGIMRVWSRYSIVVIFFLALLAGLGAVRLERSRCFPLSARLMLVGLILIELLPGRLASSQVSIRPIDQWISAQPGDFSLAFIPNLPVENYFAIYASLTHEKRMPAYLHPEHPPRAYNRLIHTIQDFPETEAISGLRKMGFRFLILQLSYFDGKDHPAWQEVEAQLAATPRLKKIGQVDEFMIFEFIR